jgi:hypothetical protein
MDFCPKTNVFGQTSIVCARLKRRSFISFWTSGPAAPRMRIGVAPTYPYANIWFQSAGISCPALIALNLIPNPFKFFQSIHYSNIFRCKKRKLIRPGYHYPDYWNMTNFASRFRNHTSGASCFWAKFDLENPLNRTGFTTEALEKAVFHLVVISACCRDYLL